MKINQELTNREKKILRLILKQRTTSEIAKRLNYSSRTIEKIRADLLRKTSSRNMIGLLIWAINNDFVKVHKTRNPKLIIR